MRNLSVLGSRRPRVSNFYSRAWFPVLCVGADRVLGAPALPSVANLSQRECRPAEEGVQAAGVTCPQQIRRPDERAFWALGS